MSVQQLFDSALALIEQHNTEIGAENPGGIKEPQNVVACLKATGATSEERLRGLSYEDILAVLPKSKIGETEIKPVALAKALANLFRGKQEPTVDKRLPHPTAVARMTLRELIERLDPIDFNSAVAKRLREDFIGAKRFIIFKEGRSIDVESTYKLADEIRQGYEELEKIVLDGDVKRIYRLGELPDNLVDENPFYVGRPLRSGEVCDQTNRSWAGVSQEIRQFIRVGVDRTRFEKQIDKVHDLLDFILGHGPEALQALRVRYADVALAFDELKAQNKLPSLRIPLNPGRPANWTAGPFAGGKKVAAR